MAVSDVDKAFLQHMLAARALTMSNAIKVYNDLLGRTSAKKSRRLHDTKDLDDLLTKMNKHLEPTEFQFKTVYSPWEKQIYCGLCNTIEDGAAKCATMLSKHDIPLFFAIVDELREFNGEIKLTDAQNVEVENQTLSVAENGRSINRLSQMGWLKLMRRQNGATSVVLGARALLELPNLRNWAREVVQDGRKNSRAHEDEMKEEVDEEEVEQEQRQRSRHKRSARRVAEEEEEDVNIEDSNEISQAPPTRRRGSRRSRLSR